MIILQSVFFFLSILTTFRFIAELVICVAKKEEFDITTYTITPAFFYMLFYISL